VDAETRRAKVRPAIASVDSEGTELSRPEQARLDHPDASKQWCGFGVAVGMLFVHARYYARYYSAITDVYRRVQTRDSLTLPERR